MLIWPSATTDDYEGITWNQFTKVDCLLIQKHQSKGTWTAVTGYDTAGRYTVYIGKIAGIDVAFNIFNYSLIASGINNEDACPVSIVNVIFKIIYIVVDDSVHPAPVFLC